MSERPKLISSFQDKPEITVALLSITAAGTGLNLTAASVVVFCELYWVPGVLEQCEARAHRMGQTSMVDVHYVCVEGSIDEQAFKSLSGKTEATSAILDGEVQAFKPERAAAAVQPKTVSGEEQLKGLLELHSAREQEKTTKRNERQHERQERVEAARAAKQEESAAKKAEIAARKAAIAEERALQKTAKQQAQKAAKDEAKKHLAEANQLEAEIQNLKKAAEEELATAAAAFACALPPNEPTSAPVASASKRMRFKGKRKSVEENKEAEGAIPAEKKPNIFGKAVGFRRSAQARSEDMARGEDLD